MATQIVGREEELSSLQAFLDDARRGPAMLVLEGEAGIGKSTLWEAGAEHARAQGSMVLSSRPAEAERAVGHLGLGDLLEGAVDDVLPALLTPRRRAVSTRISALPASTRNALAFAAAVGTTSESLLERAGVAADALDPAVAAHVIERESGMIRFTHPLLSAVLYAGLGEERRGVHARIAEIVEEPVLRARHIALSTDTPDADVARLLDDAATLATDRGASAVTAELAEQALRLTPPDRADDRRRRALAAARAHLAAGEWTRARTIATDLLAETEAGPASPSLPVVVAYEASRESRVGIRHPEMVA